MPRNRITVGTRGSRLAVAQAEEVIRLFSGRFPQYEITVRIIKTKGDIFTASPLSGIGGKGLFTREIEDALLDGSIDIAVHSLKDLPTELPEGLCLGCVPEKKPPNDCLVSYRYNAIPELPENARIGTGSPRRRAQLLHIRPDLIFEDIRGNITTRIEKMEKQNFDGLILARAGIERLGGFRDDLKITDILLSDCLPAPGQGALGIEARADDGWLLEKLSAIEDGASRKEADAERAFLDAMGGGCHIPLGAYGKIDNGMLVLKGMVSTQDASILLKDSVSGPAEDPEAVGRELAKKLGDLGARDILEKEL
ncbi:MAG: hydroxymethylbilane synthase [Chloroflexi bacterium]|nr:hydroxymethylbilane synthase [Chloroflexota bacterium]